MNFYEIQEPTEWARAPATWSSSSLDDFGKCPRRWQLLYSRWGDYPRFPVRANPAAIEGKIIHEAIDRLTRACGQRGNPAIGSPGFLAATQDIGFFEFFASAIKEWQERLNSHPRPGPAFRLRATSQELANKAIRLFREQYHPVSAAAGAKMVASDGLAAGSLSPTEALRLRGAVSEVTLRHPDLPFIGILDRVQNTDIGVEILDFKTGRPSEAHKRQLLRYALLWWRIDGRVPDRVTAQYMNERQSWQASEYDLIDEERSIAGLIARFTTALDTHPATTSPGPDCRQCEVRARCNDGWRHLAGVATGSSSRDVEVTLKTDPSEHGFIGLSGSEEVAVVYQAGVLKRLPCLHAGDRARLLDVSPDATALEIKTWTECYLVARRTDSGP